MQAELDRFDIYLERVCGLASKTCLLRLYYLSKFLISVFKRGPIDLALLKPRDIEQFVTHRGEGCTSGSIQAMRPALERIFDFEPSKVTVRKR